VTQAQPQALAWRGLRPDDFTAMWDLHRASLGNAGPEVVKAETPEFLQGLLAGRGRVTGGFAGGELVAYGVLQLDLLPDDDPRAHLGYGRQHSIAKLAGAAVATAWRGAGLQRTLIAERIRLAGDTGLLFATVAPGNPVSWSNLLASGFAVRAIELRYGGHARYLMLRERAPVHAAPDAAAAAETLAATGLPRQRELLAAGWRGVRAAATPQGPAIVFVPGPPAAHPLQPENAA